MFLALASLTAPPSARAQAPGDREDIMPPFGLYWHEPGERIEKKILNAKAKIVERKAQADGRMAWTVEGIKHNGLKRSIFYLRRDSLVGVELQYQPDGWDQNRYDIYMGQMRGALEKRYGKGQLIARKSEQIEDVTQTVVGYKWNENNASVELYYFSAVKPGKAFRNLSVHYSVQ